MAVQSLLFLLLLCSTPPPLLPPLLPPLPLNRNDDNDDDDDLFQLLQMPILVPLLMSMYLQCATIFTKGIGNMLLILPPPPMHPGLVAFLYNSIFCNNLSFSSIPQSGNSNTAVVWAIPQVV